MTEFFTVLAIGALIVGLVVGVWMVKEMAVWVLRNWPADGPKIGEGEMKICPLMSLLAECQEQKCAWWLPNEVGAGGGCAMWWLAAQAQLKLDEAVNR